MSEQLYDAETLRWAEIQVEEFADRRSDYATLADTLEQVLKCVAEEYAPLAIVQTRAKTVASFAEKCMRKRAKYRQPVDQLTDLCGGRIIVHTQEQVERISRFLEERFEIDWDNSENAGERLKTSEFGYQSVHYIVTFRRGEFPAKGFPVEVPERLFGGGGGMKNPRAEVQVRTILQHAWADIGHDVIYKGDFEAPEVWKREFARLAAVLEASDDIVARVHDGMQRLESSYGAYMTPEQMDGELQLLGFVQRHDPKNVGLALRIAGVAMARGLWPVAVAALEPHAAAEEPVVLRELGVAYCGGSRARPKGRVYRRGQKLLDQASTDPDVGAPALLALAASWRGVDDKRAREVFRRAFKVMPEDPYALAGHLEYELSVAGDIRMIATAGPAVNAAIETCEARAVAGLDIPTAYCTAGFLRLLRGEPFASLDAYAKAVQLATARHQIAEALSSLERLEPVADRLEGYTWVVRLLRVGLAARFSEKATLAAVKALATPGVARMTEPLVLVAGGCDPARTRQYERYHDMLVRGFAEFCGVVVSGGTREGVSGFVGDAAESNPALHAMSYLPKNLPLDATRDSRYAEVRPIDDSGFTPLAPLQTWIDIVSSGLDPARVRLLGINGGRVSAAEYRIALALGATVALMEDSGREAARLLPDERWSSSPRLVSLPADAASVRAFVGATCVPFPDDIREAVARDQHETYLETKKRELRPQEPAFADWDELSDEFRESSLRQADDMFAKLALIGLEAVPAGGAALKPFKIPARQVKMLAEIEHGRWVVERLLDGWRWGAVKDVKTKASPYLVPWDELTDEVQEYDRMFVRAIPATLAKHGYAVRPKS